MKLWAHEFPSKFAAELNIIIKFQTSTNYHFILQLTLLTTLLSSVLALIRKTSDWFMHVRPLIAASGDSFDLFGSVGVRNMSSRNGNPYVYLNCLLSPWFLASALSAKPNRFICFWYKSVGSSVVYWRN